MVLNIYDCWYLCIRNYSILCKSTTQYLSDQNFKLMYQPPYSPDLSPSDLFLFMTVKNNERFSMAKETVALRS